MANDDGPPRRGIPVVPVVTFVLGTLVVVAAGLGARPVLTGARWSPAVGVATVAPEQPPASVPATDEPQRFGAQATQHVDVTWLLPVLALVVLVVAVLVVLHFLRNRNRRDRLGPIDVGTLAADVLSEPSTAVGLQRIRRGIDRALAVLAEPRDPSDAVTAAWLGLQESADDAGFRRGPAETPTEFTTRILRQLDVDETALGTLRRCYLAVRFGGVPATAADVDAVRAALRTLQRQWAAVPTGRP